jgi:glycosyltransferase involved in cell wall biosynthesis
MSSDSQYQSQIFICGTALNCEQYLDAVFTNIQKIADLFLDFRIIIAFDNSVDETLFKLIQHKKKYGEKMDIIINRNPLSTNRTENICNARNSYLNKMRDIMLINQYTAQYFVALDMDDVCAGQMDIEVFKRAIGREDKWDSVSFNRTGYYDIWALSIDDYIYSCWGWWCPYEVVDHTKKYVIDKLDKIPADEFAKCLSAFCGLSIYKTEYFIDCNYDWRMPKQYMKLEDLKNQQKILWGVGSISPLEIQTDEPDCEHRAFHMSAIHKNGARIRISPEKLFS